LPGERGATLLRYPKLSAGVCSIWQQFDSGHDPRAEKDRAWKWYGDSNTYQTELEHIGISLLDTERVYTFVSLVVDVDAADLSRFCLENAEELGRIFTGGYESEEPSQLRSYIETGNLSWRSYERLFFRWTDALAVYSRDTADYEHVLFRAAQVFETCVLTRTILRALKERADGAASTTTAFWPRPWKVNRIITQFAAAEKDFIIAPPVQSVEADRLLRAAQNQFGIPQMVAAMKESVSYLDRRFQWSKAQFLGVIAIVLFFFDKIVPFKTIWPCVFGDSKTSITGCIKQQLAAPPKTPETK
jgi:hypothetical protein